jgi:hypothetical protein
MAEKTWNLVDDAAVAACEPPERCDHQFSEGRCIWCDEVEPDWDEAGKVSDFGEIVHSSLLYEDEMLGDRIDEYQPHLAGNPHCTCEKCIIEAEMEAEAERAQGERLAYFKDRCAWGEVYTASDMESLGF